jgi:hypothetical protein
MCTVYCIFLAKWVEITKSRLTNVQKRIQPRWWIINFYGEKCRARELCFGGQVGRQDMRVKHCAYGHRVATLLNPRGVTTVSYKYSLIVERYATLVVAVTSSVHYPTNYKIKKNTLFQMKFKSVNKVFTPIIIYYKLCKVPSYETLCCYNTHICKRTHLQRGWQQWE